MLGAWARSGTWEYRRRYRIPPTWSAPAGSVNPLLLIADNEAERWAAGESLRVCGRCEAQTYYGHCPECVGDDGKPVELHEGHLTNVIAMLRATNQEDEVEKVFEEIDRRFPYEPVDEDKVQWAPDIALKRMKEKREREIRAMMTGAAEAARG